MAKDLVKLRRSVDKMAKMKTQLQAVNLRLQTLKSQSAMASAMKGVTQVCRFPLVWHTNHQKALVSMNRKIDLPAMQKIMMEFERQTDIMEAKEEIIADTSE